MLQVTARYLLQVITLLFLERSLNTTRVLWVSETRFSSDRVKHFSECIMRKPISYISFLFVAMPSLVMLSAYHLACLLFRSLLRLP